MSLEERVQQLEKLMVPLIKQDNPRYAVELIASNDHLELEEKIRYWLRKYRPKRVFDTNFVADGAEYTYCVMILYEPRSKELP